MTSSPERGFQMKYFLLRNMLSKSRIYRSRSKKKMPAHSRHFSKKRTSHADIPSPTRIRMVCVSEKSAARVPSRPFMTSGIKHFRIRIVSPRPNALNIPIAACLGGALRSTTKPRITKRIQTLPDWAETFGAIGEGEFGT
jgi:hypothetical protein